MHIYQHIFESCVVVWLDCVAMIHKLIQTDSYFWCTHSITAKGTVSSDGLFQLLLYTSNFWMHRWPLWTVCVCVCVCVCVGGGGGAQSWKTKRGLGIQNLGLEGQVPPHHPPLPDAKTNLCFQNLEVWRRRRIKSPSEDPWFHLRVPWVKIILVCLLKKLSNLWLKWDVKKVMEQQQQPVYNISLG